MSSAKIFFAGDFCSKPSTSLISVSDELKEHIESCDIKVINFEVPLKQEGVTLPPYNRERFFQNDDAPEFLKGLGFNLFSCANNHAMDQGVEGWLKTKTAFGDSLFGSGLYDDAYKVKVVECNGFKIGFMALSYAANLGSFARPSLRDGYGTAYIDDLRVNHDILEARKGVDYLFILPHAGIEYIDAPMPDIINRYRDFIDYGADGVLGTHPHCPQGWEEYKGKPIFYSLGNFFFNSKADPAYHAIRPHWYDGLCVELTVSDIGISYSTINIRNECNLSLSVNHEHDADIHLEECMKYLTDKEAYAAYLLPIIREKTIKYKSKLGKFSVDDSVKGAIKAFWSAIKSRRIYRTKVEDQDYYSLTFALIQLLNCN